MKSNKIRTLLCLMALLLCLPFVAQANEECKCGQQRHLPLPDNDIVVLYTNDVHCGIDKNIGYAGLVSYRKKCQKYSPYVSLVDAGDAIQGEIIGMLSQGSYLVDIMNEVGYDFCILGNHEFDYGMPQLLKLLDASKATYLGCNLAYKGQKQDNLLSKIKPYAIVRYGEIPNQIKVAYIGVSTPESLTKSAPVSFMENDKYVYSFNGETPTNFYNCVQSYIDDCRRDGADYVIVISHLGIDNASAPYMSTDLIANTRGIDAVIDGHSHSTLPCQIVKNMDGRDVVLTSTGTKLNAIGRLTIDTTGKVYSTLIDNYTDKDANTKTFIDNIKKKYEASINSVVAHSNVSVSDKDQNGVRMVRNRETAIGDLSSDAYRMAAKSDIAFVNGGGIRAGLPKGDITFADIVAVHPYGNTLACCEATGQDILDALEFAYRAVEANYSDGKNAIGECGGFLSISGLTCTIDTSIPSKVVLDSNGMFVKVDGARRVKNVKVLNKKGEFVPIDPKATYTVASQNFTMKQCGDGFTMFANKKYIIDEGACDYQMLIDYIERLNGNLDQYSTVSDRIIVK